MLKKLQDASDDQVKALALACNGCDEVFEFDEMIDDLREIAIAERDFETIRRLRRLRWRPFAKAKLQRDVMERAKVDLLNSGRVGEFGDGGFAKWLVEWFSSEGWKIILEFIKGIVSIFA